MSTHTVQIGDGSGNSFNIRVTFGLVSRSGSWRVLDDVGYLKYTSGIALRLNDADDLTSDISCFLFGTGGVAAGWGVRLGQYESRFTGVNDAGTGEVGQAWVLQLSPGAISWALAD